VSGVGERSGVGRRQWDAVFGVGGCVVLAAAGGRGQGVYWEVHGMAVI